MDSIKIQKYFTTTIKQGGKNDKKNDNDKSKKHKNNATTLARFARGQGSQGNRFLRGNEY
jgi:hypothetical protein